MSNDSVAEVITTISLDPDLNSYTFFFDHQWARIVDKAVDGTKLAQPVLALGVDWKGLAAVQYLPYLLINSPKAFEAGLRQGNKPFWERLTDAFGEYIVKDTGLSNMRRKELQAKIRHLSTQVQDDMKSAPDLIDSTVVWNEYLKITQFQLAIWSAQRTCYGGLYYAYENFMRRCVAIGKKDESYVLRDSAEGKNSFSALQDDFAKYVDKDLANECLSHSEIRVARLVRNCLVHYGGRPSPELRNTLHTLKMDDENIHIWPANVQTLFDQLKGRVSLIADRAKQMPIFCV